MTDPLILVGGAGFVGTALAARARARGRQVIIVDRRTPAGLECPAEFHPLDLLTGRPELPPGRVVLLAGNSDPRTPHPWRLVLDNAITTARLLPALADRKVTLLSSIEVYGAAPGPLTVRTEPRLPMGGQAELAGWCAAAVRATAMPCPPWQVAGLCREMAAADPTGRWVYGLAKRAQEILLSDVVPAGRLDVLRVANVFGQGQDRVVARLVRRALAGLPLRVTDTVRTFLAVDDLADAILGEPLATGVVNAGVGALRLAELAELVLAELGVRLPIEVTPRPVDDSAGEVDVAGFIARLGGCDDAHLEKSLRTFVQGLRRDGGPAFDPPLPVVIPPRPHRPDVLAIRSQESLWSGVVKGGGPWTRALSDTLRGYLQVGDDHELLATSSGTAALRLAIVAAAGRARPGDVAVLPAFTFIATGEALAQLGYRLRFCDVRPDTWTLDPDCLDAALAPGDVRVVVAVDALGAPADYAALGTVCRRHGVPLVADSAPALGARLDGQPVGTQADAHAFSMSFAKVVSAAGGGGVVVLPRDRADRLRRPVDWTRSALLGEVHAAAALDLVERLDTLVERRGRIAEVYGELAAACPRILPQRAAAGDRHAWVHWVARFTGGDRDRIAAGLARAGICTKPYYAPVLHHHDWMDLAEPAPALPVTETLAREALALPTSSEMTPPEAERIVCAVLGLIGDR